MEKEKLKSLVLKTLVVILGSCIMGLGCSMAVSTGRGADPLAWVWEGMCLHLPITMLGANLILSALMLIPPLLWERKQISLGTILQPVIMGIVNGFFLARFPADNGNWLLVIGGLVVMGIGLGVYNAANFGRGPIDCLLFMLDARIPVPIGAIRSCTDLTLCIIAFILFGFRVIPGPILAIFIIGPVLNVTLNLINRFFAGAYEK